MFDQCQNLLVIYQSIFSDIKMLIRFVTQRINQPAFRNEFSRCFSSLNLHEYKENTQTSVKTRNNILLMNFYIGNLTS